MIPSDTEIKLKQVLGSNDKVAKWALSRLYGNQTEHEQTCGEAVLRNGRGFNSRDSKILSSMAQFLLDRGFLSRNQMTVVHRCIKQYWRQTVEGLSQAELDNLLAGNIPVTPETVITDRTGE